MSLWVKTNRFVKTIFPNYIWAIPTDSKEVFLTFDDGPIPEITEWVLHQLEQYNAKATFFCIGDNIQKHPAVFQKVTAQGHAIGNHTFNHLKGWKVSLEDYIENTKKCSVTMANHLQNSEPGHLFRPPYGKIKRAQAKALRHLGYKIIMWDVISMDFDASVSPEKCLENVIKNVENGSIIVFHDSVKAWKNLEYVLPKTLEFLQEKGFVCSKINEPSPLDGITIAPEPKQ
ncbi:polysaccharide deacetylase family protein [Flavobacterium sedimenticola]|uniref:Polysaccharide deacetylase family protein n=1 Tax=Flavobacterium sedimenticola TaxID=3043286 RepID=A0ABT6XLU9_9FLAO|nr:polysaccharide deacetylase family protein [Flavobacterium sedimenticola]MDI9255827.1 polysaccharide deacetylase family protein [Flavobacterium sedimenticola]